MADCVSVYKSTISFVALTCAWAVVATPVAGPGRAAEDKTQRLPRQILKEQGAEGELDLPRQHPCRGNLRSTNKPITLEVESSDTIDNLRTKAQGRLRDGMQIFVRTKGLQD